MKLKEKESRILFGLIGLEFHIEGRGWIITGGEEKFSFVVHGYGSKEDNLFIPNYVFCGCV